MREIKGSLKDQWVDFRYWSENWGNIMALVGRNPVKIVSGLFRYPWIYDLLKCNDMAYRLTKGVTGTPLEIVHIANAGMIDFVTDQLEAILLHPEDTVIYQIMLPSQICQAMGLDIFSLETMLGTAIPFCDTYATHRYMDFIENLGLPGDTCSFPRVTAGVVLADHCPPASCIVASNLPCDSGQSSYNSMQQIIDRPLYSIDVPYDFRSEEGLDKLVADLYGMISFLEEKTGKKMDWDKLREVCERYNEVNEMELEMREMMRSDHPPLANYGPWLIRVIFTHVLGGSEKSINLYRKVIQLMKEAYQRCEPAMKNMRYRAVLWNPPTVGYPNLYNWLEACWGIGILQDMENYGYDDFMDTSSNDAMMRSIASHVGRGAPMSKHTRGSHEYFLRDFIKMPQEYNADMIILANHIGCRNSVSMSGVMIEEARKNHLPVCSIDYELEDIRICSRQGIRDQVNSFMRNVMHAEPLDESLLAIDDEKSW